MYGNNYGGPGNINGPQSRWESIAEVVGWLFLLYLLIRRYRRSTARGKRNFWIWLLAAVVIGWIVVVPAITPPAWPGLLITMLLGAFFWSLGAAVFSLHPRR